MKCYIFCIVALIYEQYTIWTVSLLLVSCKCEYLYNEGH